VSEHAIVVWRHVSNFPSISWRDKLYSDEMVMMSALY